MKCHVQSSTYGTMNYCVLKLCDVCMVYARYMGIISLTLTYYAIATLLSLGMKPQL